MRLTVFGASGGTGQQVVRQALERGHEVSAVVRRPAAVTLTHERLRVLRGDVLDADSLAGTMEGAQAALSALGAGTQRAPTTLYSAGTSHIIAAMRAAGVSRLVGLSAVVAGPWGDASPLERRLLYPLLQRFFGASYDDMRRMEDIVAHSDIDWTIFRPPQLTNAAAMGAYRASTAGPVRRARVITRGDLARAMIDAVADDSLVGRAVTIAN